MASGYSGAWAWFAEVYEVEAAVSRVAKRHKTGSIFIRKARIKDVISKHEEDVREGL
jgi:hypothetical protein